MLFRKKVIEAVAEVLEGVYMAPARVLVFGGKRASADMPLVEIALGGNSGRSESLAIQSALGIVELSEIEQVHVSPATREAAFIAKASAGKITMVTVSSSGILQVYSNIARSVASKDIAKLSTEELRAAIALKVFTEGGTKFE
ncbi:MAG TPA: hypothetical protein VEW28_00660 [Candidatus Kapabacteria bacterium]|nr:hypothetical protein [Candidatus Kapabacteria bacterium]